MTNADLAPNHTNEPKKERGAHLRPVYNSQNKQPLRLVVPEGQLQVHTASYRGSFSVVLSAAIRAAGLGRRVLVAQFLKGGVNQGPKGTVRLCGRLEWLRPNIPLCLPVPQSEQDANIRGNAIQAVQAVWQTCKEQLLIGTVSGGLTYNLPIKGLIEMSNQPQLEGLEMSLFFEVIELTSSPLENGTSDLMNLGLSVSYPILL